MLFNSFIFIFIFLPITFVVYFYLNQKKITQASKVFLLFSSLFFYAWWGVEYLPLILLSVLFNFLVGNMLSQRVQGGVYRKMLLIGGIAVNVGLLSYFKYLDFFIENINILWGTELKQFDLILPLAISFFTFQQIAYLVDSYRNKVPRTGILNYAVFVTFFPQLIAGPIVHHQEMMPQFSRPRNKVKDYRNIIIGLSIFAIGLFKKVVLADTFSVFADDGFQNSMQLSFWEAWTTSLSYTFQLYFDFSGYIDMATGAALLFNIKLPVNFNSPYKAINIQDFWRRWHITLSRFLKDYIYIPLGGNKSGNTRMMANIVITFTIGGIWHGAEWTFIIWGILHGFALVVFHLWSQHGVRLPRVISHFVTFIFVTVSWVFFRASDTTEAINILHSMFSLNAENFSFSFAYLFIALGAFLVFLFPNSNEIKDKFNRGEKGNTLFLVSCCLLFVISLTFLQNTKVFLYYDF